MDSASDNAAELDDITNSSRSTNVHRLDNAEQNNDGGGVVEEVNKARTSGSSSNNLKEAGDGVVEQARMIATMIVKGKRTKRQRLVNALSQEEAEDEAEELDTAKCLILLAQGQPRPLRTIRRNELGLFAKQSSSNKRCYGSSGTGVYECKTCNRAFSSFQALGGHRASHKKLKIGAAGDFSPPKHFGISPSDSAAPLVTLASSSSQLSLQLGNISYSRAGPTPISAQAHNNRGDFGNRVHECSICGAEFSSGQALGGHMRRHRGVILPLNSSTTTTTTTNDPFDNTTLSLSTTAIVTDSSATAKTNTGNNDGFLSLDLNLPASPSPEDHDQNKLISFTPKQPESHQHQQSAVVFSTQALVDCFY